MDDSNIVMGLKLIIKLVENWDISPEMVSLAIRNLSL